MGAFWNPYDYSGDEVDDDEDRYDPERMDKVPKEYVACTLTKKLAKKIQGTQCKPLIEATAMGHDGAVFERIIQPGKYDRKTKKSDFTNPMFFYCLIMMLSWTLISKNEAHESTLFWATFFTVPKSNGKLRTITDCRALNDTCEKPPPTGLGSMSEILQKAAELGCTHHVQSDISHWFHLLGLPAGKAEKYFGYKIKDGDGVITRFFHRAWPMGFSATPHHAQGMCLALLLVKYGPQDKEVGIDYEDLKTWTTLPPFVEFKDQKTGKVTGFLCCQYDNVGIFLTSGADAIEWQRRILSVNN